jgi:hypothetical protein
MKKSFSVYRFAFLFALIFTMLGAVCYSPVLKAETQTIAATDKQDSDSKKNHEQILTIAQHVLSTISFSFESNSDLIPGAFEYVHFGLPFEVIHRILSASFQNSYLENIFPFAISAQAP